MNIIQSLAGIISAILISVTGFFTPGTKIDKNDPNLSILIPSIQVSPAPYQNTQLSTNSTDVKCNKFLSEALNSGYSIDDITNFLVTNNHLECQKILQQILSQVNQYMQNSKSADDNNPTLNNEYNQQNNSYDNYSYSQPTPKPEIKVYGQANSYNKIGNTTFGSDGSTYTQIGNTVFSNDGTSYNRIGNTTFGSDGSSYQKIGNTTFSNDGTSYSQIGNTTFGSDGSTYQKIGNTTFYNP